MTDLRRIDVNLIVVLDAILTEMNLTRAGELVGMSQPAVSGALARLRTQFDDPLMVRKGKTFEATPRALELKPLVALAMQEIQRTFEILPTFDPKTSTRTFYIETSDYVLSLITSPLINLIEQEAPGVTIAFDVMPPELGISQIDLLRRDVIIAGVGLGIAGKKKALFSDTFVCIADANHPNIKDGAFTFDDLKELRHCSVSFGVNVPSLIDYQLMDAGITPRVGVRVSGFLPVPFAVANSPMIGFVPERIANEYGPALGLVIVDTPLPVSHLIESVHWHPSKNADPGLVWLTAMLRKAAEIIEFGSDPLDESESDDAFQ
jgi:LysR family nod box-dependent transcriptional activator